MRSRFAIAALIAGGLGLCAPGRAHGTDAITPALEQLQKQMDQVLRENQKLREDLDEVRAATQDNWLTEQRAAEIRSLVSDVLADADQRASLLQNGMTAGWDDHFFLASADNRFRIQLEGELQFLWLYNTHEAPDRHRSGFENHRTRLTLLGHVFKPEWTYYIQSGFSRDGGGGGNVTAGEIRGGDLFLYDAWFRWQLSNEWAFRFGQFKLPFGREELVGSQYQLAVERSLINESLNAGRSQGIELTYVDGTSRYQFAISDGFDDDLAQAGAIVGVSPPNTPSLDEDSEYAFTFRHERMLVGNWKQFEDFTSPPTDDFGLLLGVAAHAQMDEFGSGLFGIRNEDVAVGATVDVSAEFGGASLFASGTYWYVDSANLGIADIYGFVVQGSMYVTPKTEIFSRFEFGGLDIAALQFSKLYLVTFGTNYYLDGHDVKWTTDIGFGISQIEAIWAANFAGYRNDLAGAEPQIVLRTQFQLLF